MNKTILTFTFGLVVLLLISLSTSAAQLTRSTLLGIMPAQASSGQGVVIQRVVANSTASELGLEVGDEITNINNQLITDFSELLSVIRPLKANSPISLVVKRNGQQLNLTGEMQPRPYEVSEHAVVSYQQVVYQGNKLRSIIYKPKQLPVNSKAPAIYFIQGYTCGSIDMGMMPNATTKQLIDQFAKAGYVVFRVEKPGVGDSQSEKHCSEIDFTTESLAFTEALKSLKKIPYVDSNNVYLWGHSLGVLHAAVVANNEPVAAIIGYGGVLKSWHDYMTDIYQHQSVEHFSMTQSQANTNTKLMKPVLDMWLRGDKNWQDVVAHKATQAAIDADMITINGEQILSRHYSFFRDLNRYNLSEYWQKLDIPLLMLHGSLDIQAINKNWAFDVVNLSSNKLSRALEIKGAEHALMRYDSKAQYINARSNRSFNPAQPGERFDTRIGQQTIDWLHMLKTQQAQFSGVNHIKYFTGIEDKPFVGNGFLIDYKGKTYAVTVKHTLFEAKTASMNSVSIDGHIKEWLIHPNQAPQQYVKLGRLINASKNEALDMTVLQRDWLVFEVADNQSDLQVLTLRQSPVNKGEVLTAYGCSYANKTSCNQQQYSGRFVKSTATNLRINMDNLDMATLRGLSGSPVLDKHNKLVGIVSNVVPKESGEGFDFAPASLDYLLAVLAEPSETLGITP